MGIVGTIIVGLLVIGGSMLAAFVGRALGWYQAGRGAGWIASVRGAMVLLFAVQKLRASR